MSLNKKKKATVSSANEERVAHSSKRKPKVDVLERKDEQSSSSENSVSDNDSQDVVDVDFEFFDPKPEDYHGVKALLRSYLDDTAWDLGGFVDLIISQTTVGTVIKTAEDESPIGVITALNLGRYKGHTCIKNIWQFLHSKCNSKADASELEAVFEKHPYDVGLLVSERLINIPEELAPPLHQGLFDEVSWATEDEPSKALRNSFKFKYYLIMTRVFQQLPKKKKTLKFSKMSKRQKISVTGTGDASKSDSPGELIYTKPEDELFHEMSHWSCQFPVSSDALAAHEVQRLKQFRLVMVLSAQQIKAFRSRFCSLE